MAADYPFLTAAEAALIRSLRRRTEREANRLFTVEGEKGAAEAIAAGWPVRLAAVTEAYAVARAESLERLPVGALRLVAAERMRSLSGVVTPPGIILAVEMPRQPLASLLGGRLLLAVEGIQDPGNLGTLIRTADWFGASGVLLSSGSVDPYNDKAARSAMGSLFRLPVVTSADWTGDLDRIREAGYRLMAALPRGGEAPTSLKEKTCLLLGSESHGLLAATREMADGAYTVPGSGRAESLNLAVSAAILTYELSKPA